MTRALAAALLAAAGLATSASAGTLVLRAGSSFDGARRIAAPVAFECEAEGAPASVGGPAHVLLPGLVDLRSAAAAAGNEEREEITPAWRALDALDAHGPALQRALRSGVTTIVASPGARNVVGGVAAAVKTDARPLRERVVDDDVAVLLALGIEPSLGNRSARFGTPWGLHFRRPGNRMGVVADVRRAAFAARSGAAGEDAEVLRRVLSGELPAWFVARRDGDIRTALRLAGELGVAPILVEAWEAHRQAGAIAAAGAAVVLGPEHQLPRGTIARIEGQDARAATASILHAAGARVALATGPGEDPGELRDRAILAARAGLPPDAALAAITSVPATLLGLGDRLGRLGPGADRDAILLDGDPLSPASRVVAVVVDGRLAWLDPPPSTEPRP